MPSAQPVISRRRVLSSAAALALLGATAAACGTSPPPEDLADLNAQLDRARSDSALATEAAAALPAQAPLTRALQGVAAERSAHAQALTDELTRMTGTAPAETTPSDPPTTSASQSPQPPTAGAVAEALKESADHATKLAANLSGYRAGLLGSIAASCTAGYTVALGGAR